MKMISISFLSILFSTLFLDAAWLGYMIKRFYQPHIGHLMGDSVQIAPAIAFYLIFAICLLLLVVLPGIERNDTILKVFLMGMVFGLATYATYDLTNQATLKDWPLQVTLVDIAWGSILGGVVSATSLLVTKYFI